MDQTSRSLLILGSVFIVAGLLWHFTGGKIPFGKLPGDLFFETKNTKVFLPITSCLLVSALMSLIAYLFRK